jgi:hypothetical protein
MRRELAEDRAVAPAGLTRGTAVQVCTRMGVEVTGGAVDYPTAAGCCVGGVFYSAPLYLFLPEGEAAPADALTEAAKGKKKKAPALGKLDPESLPDDVRAAVTGDHALTEEQVLRVLAAVGDAALKALKGAGVREDVVYARVAAVQSAVRQVLEVGEGEE